MRIKVTCPGSVMNHQGTRQLISRWMSAGLSFPVGESEHDLEEAVVSRLEGEAARRESVLIIERLSEEKPKGKR